MKPLLFTVVDNIPLADNILKNWGAEKGDMTLHRFPDKEVYVKIHSEVLNRHIVVVESLHNMNEKLLPLLFFAKTAKALGAKKIDLIAPYLGYLRQDIAFHPGEAITSRIFAELISPFFDSLTTIDPHLHRYKNLNEIYNIPTTVLHATKNIALWIKNNVKNPVIIGPDAESKQWVEDIADTLKAPYLVLQKVRHSDVDVDISIPDIHRFASHTPVLVDDIISSARTLIEAVKQLKKQGARSVIGIGVHALFAEDAYQALLDTKIAKIVTCNTVSHVTNGIDVSDLIVSGINSGF